MGLKSDRFLSEKCTLCICGFSQPSHLPFSAPPKTVTHMGSSLTPSKLRNYLEILPTYLKYRVMQAIRKYPCSICRSIIKFTFVTYTTLFILERTLFIKIKRMPFHISSITTKIVGSYLFLS